MGLNWPIDPTGGDSGWPNYSFWLVTYANRQGTVATSTVFATSADDAIAAINSDRQLQMLFGPFTNMSAASTDSVGVA